MALKLGYKASAEQFGPRELVELAVLAEERGMDSATVSDHFQPWRHNGGHAPFSLAWMTAVGERTSRLQLGTSVLTPTFRYNPAVIAQAFATMGCLYPGRVMLGVGTGEALNEIATGYQGDLIGTRAEQRAEQRPRPLALGEEVFGMDPPGPKLAADRRGADRRRALQERRHIGAVQIRHVVREVEQVALAGDRFGHGLGLSAAPAPGSRMTA